jgi:NADP-dependent aldehyde dehydrogenase
MVFGAGRVVGQALAAHPEIKAIAFTGSQEGGTSLMRTAALRSEPIPVYAEMSSINPVIWLQGAATIDIDDRVDAFVASLTLGSGQFCTNPGLLFIPTSESALIKTIGTAIENSVGQTMLSESIKTAFDSGIVELQDFGLEAVALGKAGSTLNAPAPVIFKATSQQFIANPQLQNEVFGAAALVITYDSVAALSQCLTRLQGQLTATVHFVDSDKAAVADILPIMETKAGRVIANGWPTGVEVSHAMVHGGPYPATSDTKATSVGTLAIHRFQRPVSYQGFSEDLLPHPVKQANPLNLPRRVDGIPAK